MRSPLLELQVERRVCPIVRYIQTFTLNKVVEMIILLELALHQRKHNVFVCTGKHETFESIVAPSDVLDIINVKLRCRQSLSYIDGSIRAFLRIILTPYLAL
jgi:hypothetical protein